MARMSKHSLSFLTLLLLVCTAIAQTKPISEQVAQTAMTALWRDSGGYPAKWTYDHGLVLKGIEQVWRKAQHRRQART